MKNSVLVVDDEAIVRESIRDWLANAGYDVATAETAEEALGIVAKRDFSVMVLDIRLPGQTGLSILKEVKSQRPWIKSIIITAYPSEETTREATRLGAIDYMVKPLAPDDLERLIRESIATVGKKPTVVTRPPAPPETEKPVLVKKSVVVTKRAFRSLLENLIKTTEVYGVKPKQGKFVFDRVRSADEIVLDYDVTILPPTMYLFPPVRRF